MKTMKVDTLEVKIFPTREEMGKDAAKDIHDKIKVLSILTNMAISRNSESNIIFHLFNFTSSIPYYYSLF